jgi:hypothetical protein
MGEQGSFFLFLSPVLNIKNYAKRVTTAIFSVTISPVFDESKILGNADSHQNQQFQI